MDPKYQGIEFKWEAHQRFWNWMAAHPEAKKRDWPEWEKYGHLRGQCFACDFQDAFTEKNGLNEEEIAPDCIFCPLSKNSTPAVIDCLGGLYFRWGTAPVEQKPILALQIANLPLRDDWQWEE